MTYTDAFHDRKGDSFHIAERINGKRTIKKIPAEYSFYFEHSAGTRRSIFGHPVKKITTNSSQKFRSELRNHASDRTFETDTNPLFQYLYDNYHNVDAPALNVGFFDIEADWDAVKGWAPPDDPFNKITAISLYRSHDKALLSFVLIPPTVGSAEAEVIRSEVDAIENKHSWYEDTRKTLLFDDEKKLLLAFLDAIEDVDLLTSWNGSAYDIPYTVNRVARVISKEATKKFCLFDQFPFEREYKNKFGRTVKSYDFTGRVHLDYLELYAKHNPQQRLSYALNSIGEREVHESKVQYEGSLDDLYKKEFKKFIEYNQQDVILMVKIDQKLKYIELHNQIVHANSVIFKTTMGSVSLTEQAIINEVHAMGMVVPNRKAELETDDNIDDEDEGRSPVVGAYVAEPKVGIHDNIGCADINSLYPSAIRALNMSPETLVGQIQLLETTKYIEERAAHLPKVKKAEAWEGVFAILELKHMHDKDDELITIDFFDLLNDTTTTKNMTGKQLYEYIFDIKNNVCITANGTIFRTDVEGIIPKLLTKWYAERKAMQAKQKEWGELINGVEIVADKNIVGIKIYCKENNLQIIDNKIVAINIEEAKQKADFWNQRQNSRKIVLNACYGVLLNLAFRMYDERLGQSTTLSGRTIVKHMNAKINEIITGKFDHDGEAILAVDTDSSYFTIETTWRNNPDYADFDWSKENIIALYDMISDETNETFPQFMKDTFGTSLEKGSIIRAGRELVASRGIFIKKKKYALLMFDKDGKRLDKDGKKGEMKIMGLDLRRADTPDFMKSFLETLLMNLLSGKDKEEIYEDIKKFRNEFKSRPGWEKGSPRKISDLTKYVNQQKSIDAKTSTIGGRQTIKADEKTKVNMSGHAKASFNWNKLCDVNHDKFALPITDGTRIIVCKLINNSTGMTSVAYPIDEPHLPQWFKALPFDHSGMEDVIVDNKIMNIVGVLEWDLTDTKEKAGEEFFS